MNATLQQGDVLLKKIKKLPDGLKKVNSKVLQDGEFTGHQHKFASTDNVQMYIDPSVVADTKRITPAEAKFIVVGETAYLRHEEHNPITVEPGIYQVDIVREFDYDSMEERRVVD